MRDKRPALILYVAAVILVTVAKIFNIEDLLLVAKSIVIPAIFYYYLQTRREKVNLLFSTALLFFFIADMIMVVYSDSAVFALMICGVISYSILISFGFRDARQLKSKPIHLLILIGLLILPGLILLSIVNLDVEQIVSNFMIYLLYGVILWVMLGISIYNYISKANNAFLYLCIATICLFLSDVFYCVDVYIVQLRIINILNLITQLISYYFIVRYFNLRKRNIGTKTAIA